MLISIARRRQPYRRYAIVRQNQRLTTLSSYESSFTTACACRMRSVAARLIPCKFVRRDQNPVPIVSLSSVLSCYFLISYLLLCSILPQRVVRMLT
jgi:hypothetical protein